MSDPANLNAFLAAVYAYTQSLADDASAYDVEICMRSDGRADVSITLCRTGLEFARMKLRRDGDGGWIHEPLRVYGRNYSAAPNSSQPSGDSG